MCSLFSLGAFQLAPGTSLGSLSLGGDISLWEAAAGSGEGGEGGGGEGRTPGCVNSVCSKCLLRRDDAGRERQRLLALRGSCVATWYFATALKMWGFLRVSVVQSDLKGSKSEILCFFPPFVLSFGHTRVSVCICVCACFKLKCSVSLGGAGGNQGRT